MATVVTVAEYRKLLGDNKSTDEQIIKRLEYLEAFCLNVIKIELENRALERKNKVDGKNRTAK